MIDDPERRPATSAEIGRLGADLRREHADLAVHLGHQLAELHSELTTELRMAKTELRTEISLVERALRQLLETDDGSCPPSPKALRRRRLRRVAWVGLAALLVAAVTTAVLLAWRPGPG